MDRRPPDGINPMTVLYQCWGQYKQMRDAARAAAAVPVPVAAPAGVTPAAVSVSAVS